MRMSPNWLAGPVSFLIEFLAAIPSIAYGMWGLFVLAPFLQHYVEPAIHSGLSWIPGVERGCSRDGDGRRARRWFARCR